MTEKTIDLEKFYTDFALEFSPIGMLEVSQHKLTEIVRRAIEAERALAVPPQPIDFEFNDLGIPVVVKFAETDQGLGYVDTATGQMTIHKDLDPLGLVCILIHEMMHVAEGSMLETKQLASHVEHAFIHGASAGVALALARAGYIKGLTEEHIELFKRDEPLPGRDRETHPEDELEPVDPVMLDICKRYVVAELAAAEYYGGLITGKVTELTHDTALALQKVHAELAKCLDYTAAPDDNPVKLLGNYAEMYVRAWAPDFDVTVPA